MAHRWVWQRGRKGVAVLRPSYLQKIGRARNREARCEGGVWPTLGLQQREISAPPRCFGALRPDFAGLDDLWAAVGRNPQGLFAMDYGLFVGAVCDPWLPWVFPVFVGS